MRAAVLSNFGETPQAGEVAEPEGASVGEVLAASLNPLDLLIGSGNWYGKAPDPPYVPGSEAVAKLGDGRRVWFQAEGNHGAFAERCAVPATSVEVPDGVEDATAASLGVAGLAGWLAVQWRGRVEEGETVLVLGATGPVGTVAVQAARILGAGRVVAAARDEQALDRLGERGADATVNLAGDGDLVEALREATGGGADLTIDPLWGEPSAAASEAAAKHGRIVQLGQSAGPEATFKSGTVRGQGLSILGYSNFNVPPEERANAYRTLAGHAAEGRLTLDIDTYSLDQVAEAWQRQSDGPHEKLVLLPSQH